MGWRRHTSLATLLALVALLLALNACGGGDDEAAAPAPPRVDSEQAYRDAISSRCLDARLDREIVPNPGGSGSEDLAAYLEGNLRAARRSARALEAIEPPPALAARHRRGRQIGREAIKLVESAQRAAKRGAQPDAVLRDLEPALNRRITAGNRIAEQLGTPQCRQAPVDLT